MVVSSDSRGSRDRVEKQCGLCREPPDQWSWKKRQSSGHTGHLPTVLKSLNIIL